MRKKRFPRRGGSLLLALLLCLTLPPTAALAAEQPVGYGLWIGGDEITSANEATFFTYTDEDGTKKLAGSYRLADPAAPSQGGTLELHADVYFSGDHTVGDVSAALYASYPLTIELDRAYPDVGTDTQSGNLYCESGLTLRAVNCGADGSGLTVFGSVSAQSLTLENTELWASGPVTARDGGLTLHGGSLSAYPADGDDLTAVRAAGGIRAEGSVTVRSGTCYAGETEQSGFVSQETTSIRAAGPGQVVGLDTALEGQVGMPFFAHGDDQFIDSLDIYLYCPTRDAAIYYTTDGTMPTPSDSEYTGPFTITGDCTVTAMAVKNGAPDSVPVRRTFTKVERGLDEAVVRFAPDGYEFSAWSSDIVPDFLTWDAEAGYPYIVVPGYGRESDYAGLDVSGKIAVVQRGEALYTDKYRAARNAGAAGLIVYNNDTGEIQMGLSALDAEERTIPAASVNQTAGQAAVEGAADGGGTLWFGQKTQVQTTLRNVRSPYADGSIRKNCVYVGSLGNAGYIYHLYARDALIGGVSDDAELAQFDHWSCDDPDVAFTVKDPAKPYQADLFLPNHDVTVTAHWKDESGGSSGGGGGGSSSPRYAVDLAPTEHGAVTVSPKSARKGDTVTVTAEPDSGYALDKITVKDASGKEIKLTDKGGGAYTFLMPASDVTVSAAFVKVRTAPAFGDVPTGAYYADAAAWAAEQGVTGGIGGGLFGPDQPCTRGQIVTFLWRAAGSPKPAGMSGFSDVPADSYYTDAVAWALENGITNGMADGAFRPEAPCTRAQAVTLLYRAKGAAPSTASRFTDVAADAYCAEAVAWAVENGVTQGTTDTTFSPNGGCTRAQIVTFLWRLYAK